MIKPNSSRVDAVILVGGFGTRIRHIIGSIPKPLALVREKPFLYWLFINLKKYSINNVYLLSHYEACLIDEYSLALSENGFVIKCIREESPLGTGGTILDFLKKNPAPSDPFLVMNGDSLLVDFDLDSGIKAIKNGHDGVIYGCIVEDASRYGTLEFDKNFVLTSFLEKSPGKGIVNSGVYLFTPKLFSKFDGCNKPLSLEKDLIPALICSGKNFYVLKQKSSFIDIGTESSFTEADEFINKNFLCKKES